MRRLLILAFLLLAFFIVSPARADVNCSQHTFTGEDDTAHSAELPFNLMLGDTEYDQVFITTNGTLTFGSPDANFSSYPNTPSVSVAGWDWVTFGDGAYLSYGSTDTTFCAEWSVRPYPNFTGDLTQIRLMLTRGTNGGWHGEVITFGWLPSDLRRGIRFQSNADVVTMDAAFDVNGGVPVEVPPAPVPSSFTDAPVEPTPSDTPTPEPTPVDTPTVDPTPVDTPTPDPTETNTPTPEPSDTTVVPEPTPTPVDTPTETPTPSSTPTPNDTPTPTVTPTQDVTATPSATPTASVAPIVNPTPSPLISLPAPSQSATVPMSQSLGQHVEITLPKLLLHVPGLKALADAAQAFMNIGSDMTPKQRKKAQQVVVGAIIVTQLSQIRKRK